MICLMIRHGKTISNAQGMYIGCRTDEPLSDAGRIEAINCDLYTDILQDRKYHIFCSPMKRAKETAEILFDKEYTVIDEICEIDFGDFEGKNYKMLDGNADYQSWIDSGGNAPFPHGESKEHFAKRSIEGINKIKGLMSNCKNDEIAVIVCHGGTIMAVLSDFFDEGYYDFQVKNLEGYMVELDTDGDKISGISYNCISFRSNT